MPYNIERYVLDEILRATVAVGVQVRVVHPDEIMGLRVFLGETFGAWDAPLSYANLKDGASFRDQYAFLRLGQFLNGGKHILFYDSPGFRDMAGVEFDEGECIADVIADCFGFPFYIVDESRDFIVGMDDHNFIVGAGTAAPWVESLRQERDAAARPE